MIRRLFLVFSLALLLVLVPLSAALAFTDVYQTGPTSLYSDAVADLSTRGIMSGFDDGTFRPLDSVKRMQFAKIMVRSLDLPTTVNDVCPFVDVPGNLAPSDPLYPDHYVAVCASNHITEGTNTAQKLFSPNDPITRAQVVTMVVRAADRLHPGLFLTPPSVFQPAWGKLDQTHIANAAKAEYSGLLDGLSLSWLDPWDFMTRGEIAQVLSNYLRLLRTEPPDYGEQHELSEVFSDAPTASEMAAIDSEVRLTFTYDPTASQVAPGELTPLKRRVYQVLQFMKVVRFSEPLPWTSETIYDWFRHSVREIRFTNTTQAFFDTVNMTINIPVQPNSYLLLTDKFMDPPLGGGLVDTLALFVHEGRHAQRLHTDGGNDMTLAELGAWGTQYNTYLYLAGKSNFLMDDQTRAILREDAVVTKRIRFTQDPK